MMQGHASDFSKGGWSFKFDDNESIKAIFSAFVLEDKLQAMPHCVARLSLHGSGTGDGTELSSVYGESDRQNYADKVTGISKHGVVERVRKDDQIF